MRTLRCIKIKIGDWWPVWVCGYIMAIWTAVEGDHLAIVPSGTKIEKRDDQVVITVPKGKTTSAIEAAIQKGGDNPFHPRISTNSRLGRSGGALTGISSNVC